jgi:hypothetical protein
MKKRFGILATAVAGNRGLRRRMIGLVLVYGIGACGA